MKSYKENGFSIDKDVCDVFRYVEAKLETTSNCPLNSEAIEWSIDLWKTAGNWPFRINLSKGIIKLISIPRLAGIRSVLKRCVPLNVYELKELRRIFAYLSGSNKKDFLVKYRLFIKRKALVGSNRWETLSDLAPVWYSPKGTKFLSFKRCLWRRIAGFLIEEIQPPGHRCGNIEYWNGYAHSTVKWFNCLVDNVCKEARYIRQFCEEVSRRTGMVVLSWHNATLGAMGGWGFNGAVCPFKDTSILNSFSRNVMDLWEYYKRKFQEEGRFEHIWRLFYIRLVEPKIKFSRFIEANIQRISGNNLQELHRGDLPYYFPINATYWQNMSLEDVVKWAGEVKTYWLGGWSLLWALIDVASSYIAAGRLEGVVFPRIDKFFASTLRTKDVSYLVDITKKILHDWGDRVVILLWDDTSHSSNPSLQLTINRFKRYGIPVRGLGIYDKGHIGPSPAVGDVVGQCTTGKDRVFILRPFEGLYRSFDVMLKQRDFSFFDSYVSSWRDGLAFVYAGTRVFPFLSVQTISEEFSPWASASGSRSLMGCLLQKKISFESSYSHPNVGHESDLWRKINSFYRVWANL